MTNGRQERLEEKEEMEMRGEERRTEGGEVWLCGVDRARGVVSTRDSGSGKERKDSPNQVQRP